MNKINLLFLFCLISIPTVISQNIITPSNLEVGTVFLFPEKYTMNTYAIKGSIKIPIGKIHTALVKINDTISITTKLILQLPLNSEFIDSTIVNSKNFKPIYHSSIHPTREMVFEYGEKITGYYTDNMLRTKTEISESKIKPVFDSNSYPYLIRLLPLKDGYTSDISIFDYNPKKKIGIMKASITDTKSIEMEFNGEQREVWEVKSTSDITDNKIVTVFYIDKLTKKTLKQIVINDKGQMVMERESLN